MRPLFFGMRVKTADIAQTGDRSNENIFMRNDILQSAAVKRFPFFKRMTFPMSSSVEKMPSDGALFAECRK